jgi:protein-tyrosine phosphatase
VIDLHSHILPGVDDGARDLEESCEMARLALTDGVSAIAATPHVRQDYPTTAAAMLDGTAALREELRRRDLPLDILVGAELALEDAVRLPQDELEAFTLAGTGRYLLVETPYIGWSDNVQHVVGSLVGKGLVPILAHPERNNAAQIKPGLVEAAVAGGALVQVTAASVEGRLGRRARSCAFDLIARGLVHLLASDAHAPRLREGGLAAGRAALDDDELGRYLTEDSPAAIVAGELVAPPPQARKRRRWFV